MEKGPAVSRTVVRNKGKTTSKETRWDQGLLEQSLLGPAALLATKIGDPRNSPGAGRGVRSGEFL
jgi:hypothetical protein